MRDIGIAHIELTESEIEAASDVLRSGYLRQGPKCEAFEEAFAEETGARHALSVANGTAALHLAYEAFLEPGDEVLVPSFTFIATASAVSLAGGTPVFCDVDPDTFLFDLDDARSKITDRTRAVAPVHLFGNPCPIGEVQDFAREHDLRIVWDAAQAHGAQFDGRDVGEFGDFVCYSFYPTKNMFVGEGGMICTDDSEMAERLALLRSHGQDEKYRHILIGYNYRMTDVEAAIGIEQLGRLDRMLKKRRRNGSLLRDRLGGIDGIRLQEIPNRGKHAYHQFSVVVEEDRFGCDRDSLAARLHERGVSTGVHYPRGLHQQPVFEGDAIGSSCEVTERLSDRILALPVHHGVSRRDAEYVVRSVIESRVYSSS